MSFYREYIEAINKLEVALKMQREGKAEYSCIEKGCRDFISSCWYNLEKGINEGYNEGNFGGNEDFKLKPLPNEKAKEITRNLLVRGCFKEGASRGFLIKNFNLSEDEFLRIIS